MQINQITSAVVCGPHRVGQWFCSDSIVGSDGQPIIRYLQNDGSWGRNTQYFPTRVEVEKALALGALPNFSISDDEALSRQAFRDWQDSESDRDDGCDY